MNTTTNKVTFRVDIKGRTQNFQKTTRIFNQHGYGIYTVLFQKVQYDVVRVEKDSTLTTCTLVLSKKAADKVADLSQYDVVEPISFAVAHGFSTDLYSTETQVLEAINTITGEPIEATNNEEMNTMTHEEFNAGMSDPNSTLVIGTGDVHFESIQEGENEMNNTVEGMINNNIDGTSVNTLDVAAEAIAAFNRAIEKGTSTLGAPIQPVNTINTVNNTMPVEATKGEIDMKNNTTARPVADAKMYNTLAQNRAMYVTTNDTNGVTACDKVKAAWDAGKRENDYNVYKIAMKPAKKAPVADTPAYTNNTMDDYDVAMDALYAEAYANTTEGRQEATVKASNVVAPLANPAWVTVNKTGVKAVAFTMNGGDGFGRMFVETGINTSSYVLNNIYSTNGTVTVEKMLTNGAEFIANMQQITGQVDNGQINAVKYTKEWALAHAIKRDVTPAAGVEAIDTTNQTVAIPAPVQAVVNTANSVFDGIKAAADKKSEKMGNDLFAGMLHGAIESSTTAVGVAGKLGLNISTGMVKIAAEDVIVPTAQMVNTTGTNLIDLLIGELKKANDDLFGVGGAFGKKN